ncbi:MAG: HIT family protein [Desulfovibrionaceae bacterium]
MNAPCDPDCIFCKIIAGEIPCAKILETENFLAFLDIAPVRPGHTLVVSKGHYPTLFDLPAGLGTELTQALQAVSRAVMDGTGADGFNVGMNNFKAAGQLVHHAHIHVIPRVENDGLELWGQTPYPDQDRMAQTASRIRARIPGAQ